MALPALTTVTPDHPINDFARQNPLSIVPGTAANGVAAAPSAVAATGTTSSSDGAAGSEGSDGSASAATARTTGGNPQAPPAPSPTSIYSSMTPFAMPTIGAQSSESISGLKRAMRALY